MSQPLPWDLDKRLEKERVDVIARIILDTRAETLLLHDEEAGDSTWGLGCRSYDRTKNRIIMLAKDGRYKWLVADKRAQFRFLIGGAVCGFYRGEADAPTDRTMRRRADELEQQSFVFEDERLVPIWRFAVSTAPTGEVTQISFVGLSSEEGQVIAKYDFLPANDGVLVGFDNNYKKEEAESVPRKGARRKKDGERLDAKGSSEE